MQTTICADCRNDKFFQLTIRPEKKDISKFVYICTMCGSTKSEIIERNQPCSHHLYSVTLHIYENKIYIDKYFTEEQPVLTSKGYITEGGK